MIITDRTITVKKGVSTIDEPVILYRGDYDVKVRFVIKNSRFLFLFDKTKVETNDASYAQLAIIKPDGDNVFSDISTCEEGAVSFTLTSDMIDELHEVGLYSFQIRLYDEDKQARASIPPVEYGIEIREPIASEDHTNAVDEALVGYSIAKTTSIDNEPVGPTFDEDGEYNTTQWETGDRITEGKLNKIEDALDTLNQNDKSLDRRIVNNYNALTNSFQELSDGVTADIQEMNNTIDTNFQEMNNAMDTNFQEMNDTIDTNFQEMNDTIDTNFQEMRDEIPTSVSQLEYDINDNLISNGRFIGAKPKMSEKQLESWVMWGDIQTHELDAYDNVGYNLSLQFTKEGSGGGIHQQIKDYKFIPGGKVTLSFYCDWQPNVSDPEYALKFQLDNVDVESIYGFCIQGNQSYTFTVPDIEFDTILVGFKSELGLKEGAHFSYVNMYLNNVKLEVGDKATAWCEKQHNIATRQYVDNQNYCIHGANGISGSTGYVKMCSIKVIDTYANSPIVIKFTRRRDVIPKEVIINFNSESNTDPGIASLYIRGRSGGTAYIHKSATSIYDLWIEKSEAYDHIGILDVQMSKYQADRVEITYTNEHTNGLPDGYIRPTAYNGFYIPESGDWLNNGTPVVRDDGIMDIGRYLDFHRTNTDTTDYTARIDCNMNDHLSFYCHLHPSETNRWAIGSAEKRWKGIHLNGSPDVSSDRVLKENISYVKNEKAKSEPVDEVITYKDMYDFVKDDLELATYNFIGEEEQRMNFIAQDLLYNLDGTDSKIGQMIINPVAPPTEEEIEEAKSKIGEDQEYIYPTLSYDMGMYISVLAGALKTALNKIDALEEQIASITQQQE